MKNEEKVVVITGASSGIGQALALLLVEKGYKVYGIDRNEEPTKKFSSLICDLTNYEMTAKCFEEIYQNEGRIDILVNNAGMGISGAIEHIDMDLEEKQFKVNVFSTINCSKVVIPYFRKNNGGKIINTSSLASVFPIPFQTAYSMSKSAINSFTMALKLELAPLNIKVCAVMPGDTKTGFTASREKENLCIGYEQRLKRSVEKMEKDEKKGATPLKVAKVMYKQIKRKNPPCIVSVGFTSKLLVFLEKILPRKIMLLILKKMYG